MVVFLITTVGGCQFFFFFTDLIGRDGGIPLSRLWGAVKCPDLAQKGRASTRQGDRAPTSYEALMPNLVEEQFDVEVLDMTRAAAEKLACILSRHKSLQQRIHQEAAHMDSDQDEEAPWQLSFEVFDLNLQLQVMRSTTATLLKDKGAGAEKLEQVHARARLVLDSSNEAKWDPQEERRLWLRKLGQHMEPYARAPQEKETPPSKNPSAHTAHTDYYSPHSTENGAGGDFESQRHELSLLDLSVESRTALSQSSPSKTRRPDGARAGSGLAYLQAHYPTRRHWSLNNTLDDVQ